MGTTLKTLYETDFVEWADETAKLLREGRVAEVDMEHLIEEVEGLSSSERKAVSSQLLRMLKHLIKQQIQPERSGSSWQKSITDSKSKILLDLEDAPSLRRHLEARLELIWRLAIKQAIVETNLPPARHSEIQDRCPYTIEELLEGNPEPR